MSLIQPILLSFLFRNMSLAFFLEVYVLWLDIGTKHIKSCVICDGLWRRIKPGKGDGKSGRAVLSGRCQEELLTGRHLKDEEYFFVK